MKHSFNILSDYEVGRCISSIEAVSRGTKPVAEIGNRKLEDIEQLKADLRACLELAREPNVKGFVLQQEANRWSFGFYSESWVEEAILFIDRVELPEYHRHWISGLLFGYSPDAIQRFLSCASTAQVWKGVKSALGSLRLIREKCLFRRREFLFGSTLNNLEQKTRLEREIDFTDCQIDQPVYSEAFSCRMNYPAASCGVSEQIENHLLNCHPRMSLAGVQS